MSHKDFRTGGYAMLSLDEPQFRLAPQPDITPLEVLGLVQLMFLAEKGTSFANLEMVARKNGLERHLERIEPPRN